MANIDRLPNGASRHQQMDHDEPLRLVVVKGRHEGASLAINRREFTIGSSIESDIVLSDPEIAETHVRIKRNSGVLTDRIEVTALVDDVVVGSEEPAAGTTAVTSLPADIHIGNSIVRVEGVPSCKSRSWAFALFPAGVILGGLLGLLVTKLPGSLGLLVPNWGGAVEPVESVPSVDAKAADAKATAEKIRARLTEAGLAAVMEVVTRGPVIIVRGRAGSADLAKWRALRRKLQAEGVVPGRLVDLVGLVASGAVTSKLVAAVVMLPEPMVISVDGRRAKVGQVLSKGWVVQEIGAEHVVLLRGEQTVKIKYW